MKPEIEQLIARPVILEPNNFTDHMWGGDWIPRLKGILAQPGVTIGESWEFSDRAERPTQVRLPMGGHISLRDLISANPARVLGDAVVRRFGPSAPILLKFIDARDNLSLQVHPSDEQAKGNLDDSGKAEAWLILEAGSAKDDGFIYLGFSPSAAAGYPTQDSFEEAFFNALNQANGHGPSTSASVRERSERLVLPFLNKIPVRAGEVYDVKPGTVHALGKGVRIFEIQQSSDTTYRVWDWNRPDTKKLKEGKLEFRPLHTDQAKGALNFKAALPETYRVRPQPVKAICEGIVSEEILVAEANGKFAANLIRMEGKNTRISIKPTGSFQVLTVIKGSIDAGVSVGQGASVFIPAGIGTVHVSCTAPSAQIVRSYIPA